MNPFRAFLHTILILSILNSCSAVGNIFRLKPDHPDIDSELKPLIEKVKIMSKGCLGNVKYAGFRDIDADLGREGVAGIATWVLPFFEPQISINRTYWVRLGHIQQVLLVAHELYHVEKPFLGHIDDVDDMGCAKHLMYPEIQSTQCNIIYLYDYMEQMRFCK